jgi:hypothetical protein
MKSMELMRQASNSTNYQIDSLMESLSHQLESVQTQVSESLQTVRKGLQEEQDSVKRTKTYRPQIDVPDRSCKQVDKPFLSTNPIARELIQMSKVSDQYFAAEQSLQEAQKSQQANKYPLSPNALD